MASSVPVRMLTFFLLGVLLLAVTVIAGGVLVSFAFGALAWLVLLPFRLLFKVIIGLGGAVLGVLLAPVLAVAAVIAVVVALIVAVMSLLAPLIPIVLLAGFSWAVYRLFVARHASPSVDRI